MFHDADIQQGLCRASLGQSPGKQGMAKEYPL